MGEPILIRHGQTAWSLSGQHTGRTDIPLTDAGEAAAKSLAPRLARRHLVAVFSSPLSRAMRTPHAGRVRARQRLLGFGLLLTVDDSRPGPEGRRLSSSGPPPAPDGRTVGRHAGAIPYRAKSCGTHDRTRPHHHATTAVPAAGPGTPPQSRHDRERRDRSQAEQAALVDTAEHLLVQPTPDTGSGV